ncbi:3'-5' ssDNA/RNA exonuclease tatd [Plakobranchus ocellatus]|uniref:3'-5' ssDNA/RNA exonuclease tatd n=1 Tax=Plakobranchus ocellatus TaxID=259542 RepID=A0AAV4BCH3_9GAST|nr:3'-5' ssDNA/RNA exonuclease tatd [Plakobranchus ocellatus]
MREIKAEAVAVICDEMSDDIGSAESGKVKSLSLSTRFLEATNSSSVAAAVVSTLVEFQVDFSNVVTFNSDNVSYMKKAYREVLRGLMPNSTHVTCMAHIMNLLGEALRKPFDLTNKYVKAANAIFWNAGARKAWYLRYLSQHNVTPKMPPNPIGTRNVHSRSAGNHCIQLLRELDARNVLLHAFDGRASVAMDGASRGFFFSVTASICRDPQVQKMVKCLPLDTMMVETDAPAIAPVKGETNEPANVLISCEYIAKIKKEPTYETGLGGWRLPSQAPETEAPVSPETRVWLPRQCGDVGGTVASVSTLRSAGTLLSRVRFPPPASRLDGEP